MKNSDELYLRHIKLSCEKIGRFTRDQTQDTFTKEGSDFEIVQSAVIRELEIIGEAVKHISDKMKHDNPEVQWKLIAGTRDKLIHDYMGVDLYLVWGITQTYIPQLLQKVELLLEFFA